MSIFFLTLWEEFNQVNFILLINIVPNSMPFRHSHSKFICVPLCLMDARLNRVSRFELTFAWRRRWRWPNESRENRERTMRKQSRIGNNLYLHFGPGCFARSIHEFHFHGHGRATTFSHSLRVSRRECAEMLSANIDIRHTVRTL